VARPVVLSAKPELITACISLPGSTLMASLRELHVTDGLVPLNASSLAQVFRAAPCLRTFVAERDLQGKLPWLIGSTAPLDPAFVGLVHNRLRYLNIRTGSLPDVFSIKTSALCDDQCAARLRATCFPRLRLLTVNGATFSVTPGE
jgi:hypothetical protein